ncbi:MAG: hypothetical protein ACLP1X_28325 [Polyangiaceae bacterium]|jgi:hypothetical protein
MGPYRHLAGMAVVATSWVGWGVLMACGNATAGSDAGTIENAIRTSCQLTTPTACSTPLQYADVAPILTRSCVPCHSGDAADMAWPLTAYGDVAAWAPLVQYDLCTDQMPPLDGGIAITPADRLAVLDWIQCGDVE